MNIAEYYIGKNLPEEGKFYNKFEELNDQNVPDEPAIIANQKNFWRQSYGQFKHSNLLKDLSNDLNNIGVNYSDYWSMIDKNIANIENYVRTLGGRKIEDPSKIQEFVGQVDSLLDEANQFFLNLKNMPSLSSVKFALDKMNNQIKILQNLADGELPPEGTFIGKLQWIEYVVKGRYLEAAGIDFFQKIPKVKEMNLKVLDTANLKGVYDIFGNYKNYQQMKSDIMLLDIEDSIEITYTQGKDNTVYKTTFKNFLDMVNNAKGKMDIRLTQKSFNLISEHTIAGVQSKASSSHMIKLAKVAVDSLSGAEGRALQLMKSLVQISNKIQGGRGNIRSAHKDYENLFNYALAQHLTWVVGKENNIFLTRNGLTDTYNYILENFKYGRYFQVANLTLSNNNAQQVTYPSF